MIDKVLTGIAYTFYWCIRHNPGWYIAMLVMKVFA